MERIGIYDARSRLSELVGRVESGEDALFIVAQLLRNRDLSLGDNVKDVLDLAFVAQRMAGRVGAHGGDGTQGLHRLVANARKGAADNGSSSGHVLNRTRIFGSRQSDDHSPYAFLTCGKTKKLRLANAYSHLAHILKMSLTFCSLFFSPSSS